MTIRTTFQHGPVETVLTSDRPGERLEYSLQHDEALFHGPPVLVIATFPLHENPNMEPTEFLELSTADARMLRDFLNRPEIMTFLDV